MGKEVPDAQLGVKCWAGNPDQMGMKKVARKGEAGKPNRETPREERKSP
jgi:hypothetical protein